MSSDLIFLRGGGVGQRKGGRAEEGWQEAGQAVERQMAGGQSPSPVVGRRGLPGPHVGAGWLAATTDTTLEFKQLPPHAPAWQPNGPMPTGAGFGSQHKTPVTPSFL